jgi:CHAT domain-containing protein/tetratricopeptide (TPR) repeat protein
MTPEQAGLVKTLNELADAHVEMGLYLKAMQLLEEALQLASGEPSYGLAQTLNNLGQAHRFTGDLVSATKYTQDALSVCEQLESNTPKARWLYRVFLVNLGALYRLSRKFREAEGALRKAYELCVGEPDVDAKEIGDANFSLGLLYMDLHDYASAGPHLEQAIVAARTGHGTHSLRYAVMLNGLADWHRMTGNLGTAVHLHEQITGIYRQTFGDQHPNYATNLLGLARLYCVMNSPQRAETALRQATDILENALPHPDFVECLNDLGTLLAQQGKYREAEPLLIRALHLSQPSFGKQGGTFAACLHNLVMVLPHLSEKGLATLLAAFVDLDEMRPTLQHTIATFFDLASKPNELTLFILEKIAAIERDAGLRRSYSTTLMNLGQTYRDRGDSAKAERYLTQALEVERKVGDERRPELVQRLIALANLYAATDRPLQALDLMREANRIESHLIGQVFTTGSETHRMQYLSAARNNFHVFLSLVVRYFSQSPETVRAAFDLTLHRKALAAESMAAQRDAILTGRYPELVPQLLEWRNLRMEIAQAPPTGHDDEVVAAYQRRLSEACARKEVLEVELASQIPEVSLEQQLRVADYRAVAGALPSGARLVEFVRYWEFNFSAAPSTYQWSEPRYLAFVLSSKETEADVVLIGLGPAEPIERLIGDFRTATIQDLPTRHLSIGSEQAIIAADRGADFGQRLYQLVFDPLLPALDRATRLFLANDGDLTRLPFEALPIDKTDSLIDRYELSYLNSGRDVLRWARSECGASTVPIVVADPDFDLAPDEPNAVDEGLPQHHDAGLISAPYFGRLQGTRIEGEEVARLLGVSPLLGRAALERTVKNAISPRIVHIATHGFFLPREEREAERSDMRLVLPGVDLGRPPSYVVNQRLENPLLWSGLALAGANRAKRECADVPPEAEDGILTAEDISAMDLTGTEMVVLSACETGLGEVMAGEGVYGLQRAVGLAGARTLVMSLWKVPDLQTQELMSDFYRRLLAGSSRAAALHEAKRALKRALVHPYYWAAFVCLGDPSPVTSRISEPPVWN